MWRRVDLALTDVSEESIASIYKVEKSASGESAGAGCCRLSHKSEITSCIRTERESRPHGKSTERRGLGSVVKVKPAGSRGRSISGRGSVGGGEKSRATERALTFGTRNGVHALTFVAFLPYVGTTSIYLTELAECCPDTSDQRACLPRKYPVSFGRSKLNDAVMHGCCITGGNIYPLFIRLRRVCDKTYTLMRYVLIVV
jgi:hypothetical protein